MPSAIITVPKSTVANSYASLVEAEAYFGDRLYCTEWTNATADQKTAALLMAAKILDTRVQWDGDRTTYDQSMQWPRTGVKDQLGYGSTVVYLDLNVIPKWLKDAQCEQALVLLKGDATADSDTRGLNSLSVGPIKLDFDAKDRPDVLSRQVRDLINSYGQFEGKKMSSVALMRA